jgi:hypothetical protein
MGTKHLLDINDRPIRAGDIVILAAEHSDELSDGYVARLWYVTRSGTRTAILISDGEPDVELDVDGVRELQAVTLGKAASERICDNLDIF